MDYICQGKKEDGCICRQARKYDKGLAWWMYKWKSGI